MPNPQIAALITRSLSTGALTHPGDPQTQQKPFAIPLIPLRATGMDPEHAKAVTATVGLIGPAIVHLIETEGATTLVPNAELAQLRAAEQQPGDPVPVLCQHCNQPLFWLKARNGRFTLAPTSLPDIQHQCTQVA